MTRSAVVVLSLASIGLAALIYGCQSPEAFRASSDDAGGFGSGGNMGSSGGDTGSGGSGSGGMIAASGGRTGSGGAMPPGTGGAIVGTGGMTGSGGRGTGGMTATGGRGTAGTTGSGGSATGGTVGSGGRGTGGTASGGAAAGMTGTAGRGTGGRSAGTGGTAAGGSVGTGPCAGLCTNPIVIPALQYNSGMLGAGPTCHETTFNIQGGNCSSFVTSADGGGTVRTFKINGTVTDVSKGNWPSLPAKKNGGYCFQASAGDYSYAAFVTF